MSSPAVTATGRDRFRPIREIGRGGMGRVVEAHDTELDRTVALKEALDATPEARLRFEREIAITARLEHPSIVPLYDAVTAPDATPYYVMRKLEGVPLERAIRDAASLDERLLLLPNLLAAADAVAHAHVRGVIHRDLKPSNILVGSLGETFVIDWGLAKQIGDDDHAGGGAARGSLETEVGTVMGTPGFIAPEQFASSRADERADVFALGACLFHLLAAQPPGEGASGRALVAQSATLAEAPSELITILVKATAFDPADRYLDAGGFGEELRRFLGGQLIASHRYSWRQRLARWFRRRRALVLAISAGALLAIATGLVALRSVFRERALTEAALERERDRADDLVLTQADAYASSDPTRAVATLATLRPDSPRWDHARSLLAEARTHGVAVGFPGHGQRTTSVAFAPDGRRFVTAGNGEVWLDDIDARTATALVEHAGPNVRATWCGSIVAVWDLGRTTLIDPRTQKRVVLAETMTRAPIGTPDGVLIQQIGGRLFALDLANGLATTVPVAIDPAHAYARLSVSASGAWLAGEDAAGRMVLLHRADRLRWEPRAELAGSAGAFDARETRLAIRLDQAVAEVDLATGQVSRTWRDQTAFALAYGGTALAAQVPEASEIRTLLGDGTAIRRATYHETHGHSLAASGDALVILEDPRTIAVDVAGARFTLRAPEDVEQVYAGESLVVGAGATHVLVWDLSDSAPARTTIAASAGFDLGPAGQLVALDPSAVPPRLVMRYEIRSEPFALVRRESVTGLAPASDISVLGDGTLVALNGITNRAAVLSPPLAAQRDDVTAVVWAGGDQLVLGTGDGVLVTHDRRTGKSVELAQLGGPIVSIAANRDWLAAGTSRALWRRDPGGRASTLEIEATAIALGGTGALYIAHDRELSAWRTEGAAPIARLDDTIVAVRVIPRERIAVETKTGGIVVVDPATGTSSTIVAGSRERAFAPDRSLAVAMIGERIVAIDLTSDETWTVAERLAVAPGCLATDGRSVFAGALTQDATMTVYRFAIADRAELRRWAMRATNAIAPHTPRTALGFGSLASP